MRLQSLQVHQLIISPLQISYLLILIIRISSLNIFSFEGKRMSLRTRGQVAKSTKKVRSPAPTRFNSEQQLLQQLESDGGHEMTSTMALEMVHRHLKKAKVKNWAKFQRRVWQILRVCKECGRWKKIDSILTCFICEDHFHKHCYRSKIRELQGNFVCQSCWTIPNPVQKCKVCTGQIIPQQDTHVCVYCDHHYHADCGSSHAKQCKKCQQVRASILVKPKRKAIRKPEKQATHIRETNRNLRDMFAAISSKKDNIIAKPAPRFQRKGLGFRAITQLEGKKDLIAKYRGELKKAIKAKGMNYTEDLKDIEFHLDKLQASMELGLANMSKDEEEEYLKYKSQPIGPFLLECSSEKGYGVVADMDIPERSIICEYVGEVVTLRECAELDSIQKNDSQMDLWVGANSDEKFIIRPEKWTNIARFLNGVKNSHCPRNVDSMRLCYRGLPVVLLIARRNIKKGQSLVYDYNAGGINAKYDTSGFVE